VESAALNSTASIIQEPDGTTSRVGNRTETALLELAAALGGQPERLRSARRQLARVAFSSERKRMTTAALAPGGSPDCNGSPAVCRIYTKGAPEIVLERCSHVLGPDGRRQPLPDEQKRQLLAGFAHGGQRWAGRGGRL
jgi:magnesium-transporting ATPase (P-type)